MTWGAVGVIFWKAFFFSMQDVDSVFEGHFLPTSLQPFMCQSLSSSRVCLFKNARLGYTNTQKNQFVDVDIIILVEDGEWPVGNCVAVFNVVVGLQGDSSLL